VKILVKNVLRFCNNFSLKKYEKFTADGSTEGANQKFAILGIF
jgi:hypothetical protein